VELGSHSTRATAGASASLDPAWKMLNSAGVNCLKTQTFLESKNVSWLVLVLVLVRCELCRLHPSQSCFFAECWVIFESQPETHFVVVTNCTCFTLVGPCSLERMWCCITHKKLHESLFSTPLTTLLATFDLCGRLGK
jgi:hypothetical protein